MYIPLVDAVGVSAFLLVALTIYKLGWFYSFYSFTKFLVITIICIAVGVIVSSANPFKLPITNLQEALIIQGVLFIILWRFFNFKKIFFTVTGKSTGIDRFVFFHHIDWILNIFPSLVASFFICFFVFTFLVSASTTHPKLQTYIGDSKIVKPLSYKIYYAPLGLKDTGIFNGVAYHIKDPFTYDTYSDSENNKSQPSQKAVDNFKQNVDAQKDNNGGQQAFVPPTNNQPTGATPTQAPKYSFSLHFLPTPTPPYNSQGQNIEPTPPPAAGPAKGFFIFPPTATPTPQPSGGQQVQPTIAAPTQPPFQYQQVQPTTPPFVQPTSTPNQPSGGQQPVTQQPQSDTNQAELDILRLTNAQRAQNGLGALTLDPTISNVARAHSQDMVTRNFFEHINPDGLDPFQRMKIGGVTFTAAAENIGAGPTADIIVNAWMNSAGHRANILNGAYNRIGIGVVSDPHYGLMATQDFAN
ncbi:MAG TPA: CAP domain-containing protein [Patescibacteria group bacterium]|nr:CAP domain-containing protein [Patescibacteria group bacterium]